MTLLSVQARQNFLWGAFMVAAINVVSIQQAEDPKGWAEILSIISSSIVVSGVALTAMAAYRARAIILSATYDIAIATPRFELRIFTSTLLGLWLSWVFGVALSLLFARLTGEGVSGPFDWWLLFSSFKSVGFFLVLAIGISILNSLRQRRIGRRSWVVSLVVPALLPFAWVLGMFWLSAALPRSGTDILLSVSPSALRPGEIMDPTYVLLELLVFSLLAGVLLSAVVAATQVQARSRSIYVGFLLLLAGFILTTTTTDVGSTRWAVADSNSVCVSSVSMKNTVCSWRPTSEENLRLWAQSMDNAYQGFGELGTAPRIIAQEGLHEAVGTSTDPYVVVRFPTNPDSAAFSIAVAPWDWHGCDYSDALNEDGMQARAISVLYLLAGGTYDLSMPQIDAAANLIEESRASAASFAATAVPTDC